MCVYETLVGEKEKKREKFWKSLCEYVRNLDDKDQICLLGNLSTRMGNIKVKGMIEQFRVNELNGNRLKSLECMQQEVL